MDKIILNEVYNYTVTEVWDQLVDHQNIETCTIDSGDITINEDHAFTFNTMTEQGKMLDFACRVKEYSNEKFITYYWDNGDTNIESTLSWRVIKIDDKHTRITLEQTGLLTQESYDNALKGWKKMLTETLLKQLETSYGDRNRLWNIIDANNIDID